MPAKKRSKVRAFKPKASPLHELRIREVAEAHGLQTRGFSTWLRRVIAADDDPDVHTPEAAAIAGSVRPDAFCLDEDSMCVQAWEVVYGSPPKMAAYYELFWLLDNLGWLLSLVYVEARTGMVQEVDIMGTELETLAGFIPEGMLLEP